MFAENGADIVITYNSNKSGAEEVAAEIQKIGRKVYVIQADLCQEKDAEDVVLSAVKEFGKIDILVNNAGRYVDGDEWNGVSEIWMKSLRQNLLLMMNISKYVIPVFKKQNSGVMVNVASRHGIKGHSDAVSYSAAKAGVINLTGAYSDLLQPFGRANSVSPSATRAGYWLIAPKEELEQTLADRPNHKLVEPETVAKKIVYLASDEAKDITGQNFPVTE